MKRMVAALVAAACLFSCATAEVAGLSVQLELTKDVKPASSYTAEINSAVYSALDFSDTQEAEFATRSLIDAPEVLELKDASGKAAWSQAAMQLIEKNLGSYPIKAVVISHSHANHFLGGIGGVMTTEEAADASLPIEEQQASSKNPIIVPQGFAEHAIAENIYAGKSMLRRANYQYGVLLVYADAHRDDADASLTCPKNALMYILANNQQGLATLPVEGDAGLITLLAQSMNQFPLQGIMPFNIVEP